jgi:HEAT repeat protein
VRAPLVFAFTLVGGLAAADSYGIHAARLRHADPTIRIEALCALTKNPDYRALEDVSLLLKRESRPEVRRVAVRTLLAYADESTLGRPFFQQGDAQPLLAGGVFPSDLTPYLADAYAPYAAFTLGELGDRQATSFLFRALEGAQGRPLFYTADALRKLRAPGLAERLIFPRGSASQRLVTPILEKMVCRESIPDLVAAYRRADAETRSRLVSLIGQHPNGSAVEFLNQVLPADSESEFLKLSLRFSHDDPASKRLWAAAYGHPRPNVSFLADIFWSRHPDPAMKDRYLKLLREGKPEHLHQSMAALGKLRVETARPLIEQRLIASNYEDTVAAQALARIGDPRSLPLVARGLRRDHIPRRYVETVAAFGPAAIDVLLKATRHPHPGPRSEALAALGEMKARRAWKRVARMVDEDPDLGIQALTTLGELGEPKAIPVLAAHLESLPGAVAEALGMLGPASRPILVRGLGRSPRVANLCARALGVAKDRKAVPSLLRAFDDPELRQEVAVALGRIGDRHAVPTLIRGFDAKDAELRKSIAAALAQIGDRRALPKLGPLARDPNPAVRQLGRQAVTAIVWPGAGVKVE